MYSCPPPLREYPYSNDAMHVEDVDNKKQLKDEVSAVSECPPQFEDSLKKITRIKEILSQPFHENNILETTVVPIFFNNNEGPDTLNYFYEGQIFYHRLKDTFNIVAHGYGTRFCPENNETLTGFWLLNAYVGTHLPQNIKLHTVSGVLKRNGIIYEGKFYNVISNTGEGFTYQFSDDLNRPSRSQWVEGKIINIVEWKVEKENSESLSMTKSISK